MRCKEGCPLCAVSGYSRLRRQSRTTGSIFLNRWTWHRPERAEYATITGLGFKSLATSLAVIEILASVGWHALNRLVPTRRAGNRRDFDHGTCPPAYCCLQATRNNVRFGSLADILRCGSDVCFTPKSGHASATSKCPLSAKSRHSVIHLITSLAVARPSIRQQDGQGCIPQDVLGCPAEYPLSQSALRVGALD